MGKVWIQVFSFQQLVDSRAGCALTLVWKPVLEKKNTEIELFKRLVKMTLCHILLVRRGWLVLFASREDLKLYRPIGLVGRVFTNSPGYQILKKWYSITPSLTLTTIKYVSRVKWNNPGEGVAPFPFLHLRVVAIEKGAFGSLSTTVANLYLKLLLLDRNTGSDIIIWIVHSIHVIVYKLLVLDDCT